MRDNTANKVRRRRRRRRRRMNRKQDNVWSENNELKIDYDYCQIRSSEYITEMWV